MSLRRALYTGTFDPFTNGHLDIVDRALVAFDEVIVLVAQSERKVPLLTVNERVKLIREALRARSRVKVDSWDGLVVDYARKHKATILVRGLRAASDFEYEFMMAAMNKELRAELETFFMMTGSNLFFVSSSMIKELFRFGGDVSPYVPSNINRYLLQKRKQRSQKTKESFK